MDEIKAFGEGNGESDPFFLFELQLSDCTVTIIMTAVEQGSSSRSKQSEKVMMLLLAVPFLLCYTGSIHKISRELEIY